MSWIEMYSGGNQPTPTPQPETPYFVPPTAAQAAELERRRREQAAADYAVRRAQQGGVSPADVTALQRDAAARQQAFSGYAGQVGVPQSVLPAYSSGSRINPTPIRPQATVAPATPLEPWTGVSPATQNILDLYGFTMKDGVPTVALTPAQEASYDSYVEYMADMEEAIARAQGQISAAYGGAAARATQEGERLGRFGGLSEEQIRQGYAGAAARAADLGQAGGTQVSGLMGPSQGFRSLYGTLPGMGDISAEGMELVTRSGVFDMDEYARQAKRSGNAAARAFAEEWDKLSRESQLAIKDRINRENEARTQEFSQLYYGQQAMERASRQGGAVNLYNSLLGTDKNARRVAEDTFRSYGYDPKSLAKNPREAQRAALAVMSSMTPEELIFSPWPASPSFGE